MPTHYIQQDKYCAVHYVSDDVHFEPKRVTDLETQADVEIRRECENLRNWTISSPASSVSDIYNLLHQNLENVTNVT